MRIPQQVSERVKEAPAQALRAVFSGIGQVLLVADRIKSRAAEPERGPARPRREPVPQAQRHHRQGRDQVAVARRDRERQADPGEDTPKAKPAATPPVPETP